MADENFEMQEVVSTQLAAVGYDADKKALKIQFNSGGEYLYSDVPQDIYEQLLNAPSVGQFFNANVKWNFPYVRLT